MDIDFDVEQSDEIPEFNQKILEGLVYHQTRNVKEWIDRYIRTAEKSFPEGIEYVGSSMLSPAQALYELYGKKNGSAKNNRRFCPDMASSDIFLVRYHLRYNGQDMNFRHMFLPNFKPGNRIRIAGNLMHAQTPLVSPGFSVPGDSVFFRMTRSPVTFLRSIHTLRKDGKRFSKMMVHSRLHWKGGANDRGRSSDTIKVGDVVTTLSHYLFCEYGVEETFRKYGNTHVVVKESSEVTDEEREQYTVYTSQQTPPRSLRNYNRADYSHIATTLAVLLPKDAVNTTTEDMVATMFYMLDHFPELETLDDIYSDWQWKVWLGYTLWGDLIGHGKLVENVESHLRSLDDHMDVQTQNALRDEEDIEVDTTYDFFAHMIGRVDDLIANNASKANSMYNRRLTSVPYVLKDIIHHIFHTVFEMSSSRRKVDVKGYEQILGRNLKPMTIMGLRDTGKKPFMMVISTPGDNMYYRGTSRIIEQERTGEASKGGRSSVDVNAPANHLHVSGPECGSYGILPHSYPLAKATINPMVNMDDRYTLIPNPELDEVREYIENVIDR